jgi:hypothetical protein
MLCQLLVAGGEGYIRTSRNNTYREKFRDQSQHIPLEGPLYIVASDWKASEPLLYVSNLFFSFFSIFFCTIQSFIHPFAEGPLMIPHCSSLSRGPP